MRGIGPWLLVGFVLLLVGASVFACFGVMGVRTSSIVSTASPTELGPGQSFVAASGSVDGSSRLEFHVQQWENAPISARVTCGAKEILRMGPKPGRLDGACALASGPFELHVENVDAVARTVDVQARIH